jgi:hypothetical protein
VKRTLTTIALVMVGGIAVDLVGAYLWLMYIAD